MTNKATVESRIATERRIMTIVIESALSAGYAVGTNCGDGQKPAWCGVGTGKEWGSISAAVDELCTVDDSSLTVFKLLGTDWSDRVFVGTVLFVRGNDNGENVVCDYSIRLEKMMVAANAESDRLASI